MLRASSREWRIGLINGPNMSNIARRDPAVYGRWESIGQLEDWVAATASQLGAVLTAKICSNHEGDILEWIHANAARLDGIIINPAGLTQVGYATRGALRDSGLPVVELHFANPHDPSIFTASPAVVGTCQGLGRHSYTAALVALVNILDDRA